jgi:hypothetical protein
MRRPSRFTNSGARELFSLPGRYSLRRSSGGNMRSVLLWAIGIPLPIIIILWLVTGHA